MSAYENHVAAVEAVADAALPGEALADIAFRHADLRTTVARHPNAYPGLLDWLAKYGDEETKDEVVRRRATPPGPSVTVTRPDDDAAQTPSVPVAQTPSEPATQAAPVTATPVAAEPAAPVAAAIPDDVPQQFCAVDVVGVGEQRHPYVYAGTDETGSVLTEPWDGAGSVAVSARSVTVAMKPQGSPWQQMLSQKDVDAMVRVTESRVIVSCPKVDAGGMLLGQLRYEWVTDIAYNAKHSMFSDDVVRLFYRDRLKNDWNVELTFRHGVDVAALSNQILVNLCRYRLAMTDAKDERETSFFQAHLVGEPIAVSTDPQHPFSLVTIPTSYRAPVGQTWRPPLAA